MKSRAQTTVELLIILSISMVALAIVYSLYAEQVELSSASKDTFLAKSAVQKISYAANVLALSGAGSEGTIEIEIPNRANLAESGFFGRTILIRLTNLSDVFSVADVNLEGSFGTDTGKKVLYLYYDGNIVHVNYNEFELSKQSLYVAGVQGSSISDSFSVRNNSSSSIEFFIEPTFSHAEVSLSLGASDDYFTLAAGALNSVDLTYVLSSSAIGNYSGVVKVTARYDDQNHVRYIKNSVESLSEFTGVSLLPKNNEISAFDNTTFTKPYSLCNYTDSDISITSWSVDGNADANAAPWITLPNITSVVRKTCTSFDLNFVVPAVSSSGVYDANLTVNYSGGSPVTADMNITITQSSLGLFLAAYQSTDNNTLPANYALSQYVYKRSDTNTWTMTGEIDWNVLGLYHQQNVWTKYDNSIPNASDVNTTNGRVALGTGATKGDVSHVQGPSVILDGNTYKMWYSGFDVDTHYMIYYATSVDGLTWTKYNNDLNRTTTNSVNQAGHVQLGTVGRGDEYYVLDPIVIKDGSTYKMWYTGNMASGAAPGYRVFYATSTDGVTWTKYNNTALDPATDSNSTNGRILFGTNGKGDDAGTAFASVIKDSTDSNASQLYKMWYSGYDGTNYRIFYAVSSDGLTWTKYDNSTPANSDTTSTNGRIPLGSSGRGDSTQAYLPTVVKDNNIFHMWYSGYDGTNTRIFYATSLDGLTWTKYDNRVPLATDSNTNNSRVALGNASKIDTTGVAYPSVIKDGNYWKMWHSANSGSANRIEYETQLASSTNWDANLIAYYKFNDKNGTTVFDSARGNNGTLTGGADINGVGLWDSNTLLLNGTTQYVNFGTTMHDFVGTTPRTFSMWVKPVNSAAAGEFISKYRDDTGAGSYIMGLNGVGGIRMYLVSTTYGTGRIHKSTSTTLTSGQWSHVVFVWDGTLTSAGLKIYINSIEASYGALDNGGSFTGLVSNTQNAFIGARRTGASGIANYLNGLIDEIKIYDRNLSATEILADYNNFLSAKLNDSNIIDASASSDWNSIKINKNIMYDFDKQLESRIDLTSKTSQLSSDNNLFDQNLVGLWHLNDKNASGWVLNSVSGVRDGNAFGVFDTNAVGLWDTNAGWFNGSNNYILPNNSSDYNFGTNNFSLGGWVKINGGVGTVRLFASKYNTGFTNGYGVGIDSSNKFEFFLESGSAEKIAVNTVTTTDSAWHHVIGVRSGDSLYLYVDGLLVGSNTGVSAYNVSGAARFLIGARWASGTPSLFWNGTIEEVAIWNRSLSSTEVASLYNSQAGRFAEPNMVGLWHLNDKNASGWVLNSVSGVRDGNAFGVFDTNAVGLWDTNAGWFDGNSGYVSVPFYNLAAKSSYSVSGWIKSVNSAIQGQGRMVYGEGSTSTATPLIWIAINTAGKMQFEQRSDAGTDMAVVGLADINDNRWHSFVATKIASNSWALYIDGVLLGTSTTSLGATTTNNSKIGIIERTSITAPFAGTIEDLAIWDRALTSTEIKDLYRKGVSRLDLNVYSCSNATCLTKTSSQYINDVNNSTQMDFNSSLINSRYLGVDTFFKKARGLEDYNAGTFYVGTFLNDLNVSYTQ